ncbi:unnamed protein product [Linum trigynum]|uniref:NAC domain-containing protein n=1 Tax=Linum trigynum TaxID=586398 RepID=A0AAV2G231_9ROSI
MATSNDGGVSRETQMSIEASSMFPGFKFSPTDVELISYYLKKKLDGDEKCVEVIPQVEICKHEPWDLPAKSIVQSETEWFFFSPRGRKYPNGSQSKRATPLGYWKATGKERNVRSGSAVIGTKRTLVFHIGRAPKGERTEWIMHEYALYAGANDSMVACRLRRNVDFRGHHSNCSGISAENKNEHGNGGESSKKTDSSSDSHSIEQPNGGATPAAAAESSSRCRRDDQFQLQMLEESCRGLDFSDHEEEEDDFFADILNDDIVRLDDQLSAGLAAPDISAAAAIQGLAPSWLAPQQQQGKLGEESKDRGREREEAEAEEAEKERQKREKKLPSCAVGLVMFVEKKRGKAVAVLFVVTVLIVVGLMALFGSLFSHDKVSGRIRELVHLPALAFRSHSWKLLQRW